MKIEQTVGEGAESVYLYYFPSQRVGAKWPCKIGKSKGDPVKRINHQQASMREEPVIGLLIKTHCAAYDEQVLHNALSKCKLASYGKEWYETNPNSALIMYQNCQDDLTLGQQIKLRRYAHGMSQADLARTASVRQATVSSVENDENVEWATLREILRELKLKVQLVPIEE